MFELSLIILLVTALGWSYVALKSAWVFYFRQPK